MELVVPEDPSTYRKRARHSETAARRDGGEYLELAAKLRKFPNSTEFVYLRRLDKSPNDYDPYALVMKPYEDVDPADYYTMSVQGITRFVEGVDAEFTTLEQWEREYKLFYAMRDLKVFSKFRPWKGFSTWIGRVRHSKMNRAQKAIEKRLLCLDPLFQAATLAVRARCFELSETRLSKLKVGEIRTLEEFRGDQAAAREEMRRTIHEFGENTIALVDGACDGAMEDLERRLNDFYGAEAEDDAIREDRVGHETEKIDDKVNARVSSTLSGTKRSGDAEG